MHSKPVLVVLNIQYHAKVHLIIFVNIKSNLHGIWPLQLSSLDCKPYMVKVQLASSQVQLPTPKSGAEKEEFTTVSPDGDGIFHIEKQMDCTNRDIFGENRVRYDAGDLALTDEVKMKAWAEHYARLLNVEFEWSSNELPGVPLTAGSCPQPWSTKQSAKENAARLLAHLAS